MQSDSAYSSYHQVMAGVLLEVKDGAQHCPVGLNAMLEAGWSAAVA